MTELETTSAYDAPVPVPPQTGAAEEFTWPPFTRIFPTLGHALGLFWQNLPLIALLCLLLIPIEFVKNLGLYALHAQGNLSGSMRAEQVVLFFFGTPIEMMVMFALYRRLATGTPVPVSKTLHYGMRQWGNALGVCFSAGIRIGLGLLLLIVPGIILAVRYALALVVLMMEGTQADALERSTTLCRGHWWNIFGAYFIGGALVWTISTVVGIPLLLVDTPWMATITDYLTDILTMFYVVLGLSIYLGLTHAVPPPTFSAAVPPPFTPQE